MNKQKLGAWQETKIYTKNGCVTAKAHIIVSASRSTDIPAFYADWFFHRLKIGYSVWTNPFNRKKLYIDYSKTKFIVFWSKNPKPMLNYIDQLKENNINWYLQYSLNDYETVKPRTEKLNIECNVPPLKQRIETFQEFTEKYGKDHVIWRFDPLLLTDRTDVNDLLERIERVGNSLYAYTHRFVFSFADIAIYPSVKRQLDREKIKYTEWTEDKMQEVATGIQKLNQKWHLKVATCGEKNNFEKYDIKPSHCIDEDLIIKIAYQDKALMDYLRVEILDKQQVEKPDPSLSLFSQEEPATDKTNNETNNIIDLGNYIAKKAAIKYKDNGQRAACGCTFAKDIGQYGTCLHQCQYCYANGTANNYGKILANWERHNKNPFAETITGE